MSEPSTIEPAPGEALAPHPPIRAYYEDTADGKRRFVRGVFDEGATDYDRVERIMSLGSGSKYRRRALHRAGLVRGMRVLDVAAGTGLVTREAAAIVGDPSLVLGVDPSPGMLAEAVRGVAGARFTIGTAERLPVSDAAADFLSMGYALRHVTDIAATFREFLRVLKPGGRVCVLEITRPRGRVSLALLRVYMGWLIPGITRLAGRRGRSRELWSYYWDTIEQCVPPEQILDAMHAAGFADVGRHVELGIFSAYTATRPKGAGVCVSGRPVGVP
jgi:demethylmenaquinone methyltransferase/2-methoxy-6-polyprenyl-1,4-benzoquinol methylase